MVSAGKFPSQPVPKYPTRPEARYCRARSGSTGNPKSSPNRYMCELGVSGGQCGCHGGRGSVFAQRVSRSCESGRGIKANVM
eukprot:scaffold70166_cov59-Attheya_sp.AAC.3